jgi:hypothetical protein
MVTVFCSVRERAWPGIEKKQAGREKASREGVVLLQAVGEPVEGHTGVRMKEYKR